jgi:hypothetical protein
MNLKINENMRNMFGTSLGCPQAWVDTFPPAVLGNMPALFLPLMQIVTKSPTLYGVRRIGMHTWHKQWFLGRR